MPRHRVPVQLRWSDMDVYGHVNNVQYLRLFEEARVVTFGSGIVGARGPDGEPPAPTGLVVARSEVEYLRPLEFRTEPVAIDLWATAVRAAEVDLAYQVKDARLGILYAQALTVMVAFDLRTNAPRRFTDEESRQLEVLEGPPLVWKRRVRTGGSSRARPSGARAAGARGPSTTGAH